MIFTDRRRAHGELLEKAVLGELERLHIITPLQEWGGGALVRPGVGQPYLKSINGSSEQPLDEVAWVVSEDRLDQRAFIVEVKSMRYLDWFDWLDHKVIHKEKIAQHKKHIQSAIAHKLHGVCIIAVNKDSSQYLLRAYDTNDVLLEEWDYEC